MLLGKTNEFQLAQTSLKSTDEDILMWARERYVTHLCHLRAWGTLFTSYLLGWEETVNRLSPARAKPRKSHKHQDPITQDPGFTIVSI